MSRMRRCLLVEALPYHWEVLPHWTDTLRRVGCEVEVATSGGITGHEETRALLESQCRTHDIDELDERALAGFDFVVLNSVVHEGYFFRRQLKHRPNLQWIRNLGRPSIGIVHEPVHWVEKRIVHSFREEGDQGRRILNLLADGCFQYEFGFWSPKKWSLEGNLLRLPDEASARTFRTSDGGRSFRELDAGGATLVRRDITDEDLSNHCTDHRHAILTLTEAGARHLGKICDGVDWILPLETRERMAGRATGEICFAGLLDYDRKSLHSLVRDCGALQEGRSIRIIGGSLDANFDEDWFVKVFKRQLEKRGLASKFSFTGYLSYGDYVEQVRRARFLLPLVDDFMDSGSYMVKLPAAIACSLSFGIPLIVNQRIAERFGLEYMICYSGEDLASGLKAEQELSDRDYDEMLVTLDRHADSLHRRNLDVLARLIERITG